MSRLLRWLLLWLFVPGLAAAADSPSGIRMLLAPDSLAADAEVVSGLLDSRLEPLDLRKARTGNQVFWLRLRFDPQASDAGIAALVVHRGRHFQLRAYQSGSTETLDHALTRSVFRGTQDQVFAMTRTGSAPALVYLRVEPVGSGAEELSVTRSTLDQVVARGAGQSRVMAGAFAALIAMSLAAVLIWFVLPDRLFLLYATLFSLQALYVAYLSGEGFDWAILSAAAPLQQHAWNVPAALSGAAACLFVREIAELRRFSPRIHAIFGGFAIAFVVLAFSNVFSVIGAGAFIADIGNLMFLGTAVFTLVVSFLAWRRGNRAAGWFLVAWFLLETFTIATAASFLFGEGEPTLLYIGLPLSMVAAAILVALGVADRLRDQRRALSEAERRAQLDPLTGVLNRRSILERLEAACVRAQARGLPIALLFIDLDHFKAINDSHGHMAGDDCLRAVIPPIQAELRQSDVIGRYGGEEFVVILSSADAVVARGTAERIVKRVADLSVPGHGAPIRVTCSIGVASSDVLGVWGEQLIARADAAVYAAKRFGRNQVQSAEHDPAFAASNA